MASFQFRLLSVALAITAVTAAQHASTAYKITAQARVASLLKERHAEVGGGPFSNNSFEGWLPFVVSDAQHGKLPHQDLEREFHDQFIGVIGAGNMDLFEHDLKSIMYDLSDTYGSLSKNEYGDVGQTAVRYALHRLFVARRGWYIQGIDPAGESFSSSSPAEVLKGRVPDDVQEVVEKLLSGRGFGLYETAVLGAVLESLIHKETIAKAAAVFSTFGLSIQDVHRAGTIDVAIDHYMASYIMGRDVATVTRKQAVAQLSLMSKGYPGWTDTQAWTRSIRESHGMGGFSFNATVAVLIEIGEKYGKWQQKECISLKRQLMELENEKNGCVPVSNFYKKMVEEGKWEFTESPNYLRELGALDESDPTNLKVIIPNYLDGISNCVASSSYYSVCCINECEGILASIERFIQAPDASPDELLSFVSRISSSTVVASSRQLRTSLVKHLNRIAKLHGGRVPIHSRLFAQWLHNAYPHECPYPHMAGTTNPMTPEMWFEETGDQSRFSNEEMKSYIAITEKASHSHRHAECGKWLDAEELYEPWILHANQKASENMMGSYRFGSTAIIATAGTFTSILFIVLHVYRNFKAVSSNNLVAS